MRRKTLIILSIAVFIAGTILLAIMNKPKLLGSIKRDFDVPTSDAGEFEFFASKGEIVKLTLKSDIDSGELNIVISDSDGDVVKEFRPDEELETLLTFDDADIYTLSAACSKLSGKFRVSVHMTNK